MKATILIIEDEAEVAELLARYFFEQEYHVLRAVDGAAGLSMALSEHPDVVLLDIMMPKKDGIEVLQELRNDTWGAEVPVVLLTNVSDTTKIADAIKYGVKDYFLKSDWRVQEVAHKIQERLGIA